MVGIVATVPLWFRMVTDFTQSTYLGYALVLLAVYLSTYVVLTLVFARVPSDQSRAWAKATDPGTRFERFVLGTQPGAGMATGLSGISLMAVVLGRSSELWGDVGLSSGGGAVVVVALLVASWLAVVVTYAVEYMCRDQREPGVQLAFPGGDEVGWIDYLYFSLAISTTFGTTDVDVRKSTTRRTVAGHGFIAFLFNTIIIVIAISALA